MSEPSRTAPDVTGANWDRRKTLKRLAIGGTFAWTTPMILSSTVAAAVPSTPPGACTTDSLYDWDPYTAGTAFTSITAGGVTMTASTSFFGGTAARSTNLTIVASPQGGINQKALRFEQTPVNGGGQTITLNFSKQVRNLSFSFFDVDNSTDSGWSDRLVMVTTPFTSSIPATSTVVGAGTVASPFRNSQTNANLPNTSGAGNVTVTWAGPVAAVTFLFQCSTTAGGTNQLINISDIAFCR